MKVSQQTHDHLAGPMIQVSGRLIRQQQPGISRPAPLPAQRAAAHRPIVRRPDASRELAIPPHLTSPVPSTLPPRRQAANQQRHHYVLERRKLRQQRTDSATRSRASRFGIRPTPLRKTAQILCWPKYIVPFEGLSRPPSKCSNVDFPAPDSPTMAISSPGRTSRNKSSKTTSSDAPE